MTAWGKRKDGQAYPKRNSSGTSKSGSTKSSGKKLVILRNTKLISDAEVRLLREKLSSTGNFPDDGMKRSAQDSEQNFRIQTRAIARKKLDKLTNLTRRGNPKTPLIKEVPFGKERRPREDKISGTLRESDRRDEFLALHTYEQSEYFEDTTDENRQKIFQYLSPEEVANFFDQLDIDDDEYELLFDKMNATYASHILEEMSYDNAVDILNELTKPKVASLLTLMNKDDANEIKALLHYDEDTAGGIMTTEYLSLKAHTPVKEALLLVKAQAPDAETIYVIFVVDDDGKLVGVLSLRDLIVAENDAYIEDIMNERVISVNVADDQEDVAQVMRDYDFMAVPVIDYQEHLLGIITIDDILDVMDEEASEDYSRLVGVSDIDLSND